MLLTPFQKLVLKGMYLIMRMIQDSLYDRSKEVNNFLRDSEALEKPLTKSPYCSGKFKVCDGWTIRGGDDKACKGQLWTCPNFNGPTNTIERSAYNTSLSDDEKRYRKLKIGETVKAGDQFKRIDGAWVSITQRNIDSWAPTGKPIIHTNKNIQARRRKR